MGGALEASHSSTDAFGESWGKEDSCLRRAARAPTPDIPCSQALGSHGLATYRVGVILALALNKDEGPQQHPPYFE